MWDPEHDGRWDTLTTHWSGIPDRADLRPDHTKNNNFKLDEQLPITNLMNTFC